MSQTINNHKLTITSEFEFGNGIGDNMPMLAPYLVISKIASSLGKKLSVYKTLSSTSGIVR